MGRKYVVAPTANIANYYAGKIGVNYRLVNVFCEGRDCNKLRGLKGITIIVLNHYDCDRELLDFIAVLSTTAKIKLEFENV